MKKKWIFRCAVCILFFCFLAGQDVKASEAEEWMKEAGIYYEEIDKNLKETSLKGDYSFGEIMDLLLQGDIKQVGEQLFLMLKEAVFGEMKANRKNMMQIILLAVFAALFSNIASGFLSSSLQETGFFAVYLSMSGLILGSFGLMKQIADQTLSELLGFMEALIPSYAIAVTMVSGSASSIALYELTFFLIRGCQLILQRVLLPVIECYMLVGILNYVGETDRFSYLGGLMRKGVEQSMKWGTGMVLGFNLIQNMILPALDSLKSGIWQKSLSVIPGAGPVISAVTGSLLGSSVLIKNSIGVGGIVFLFLILVVPVLKLLFLMLSFYLCTAFLQPVSDKRLVKLLHTAGEGGKMLLEMVITCFALFFITIALVTVSTNMRYYAL